MWPLRRPQRRLPLQQRENHAVSDDPRKTLSSRSQTLSCLQPVEPPQRTHHEPEEAAGARDPRGGRKTTFPGPIGRNKQSRIVLLAPLPEERKPAIGSHACNALILHRAANYSDISWSPPGAVTSCRLRFSSPTSPRTPARFCGFAPAWMCRPTLSNRPAFRCPTGIFAAPAWTISTRSPSCATNSWSKFEQWRNQQGYRLILFTTKSPGCYLDYRYEADDILLFGRESAGVPDEVVAAADARLVIPIKPGLRSLNVAVAAAMALGEALRQIREAIPPLDAG